MKHFNGLEKKILTTIRAEFPNGIRDDFIDAKKILRAHSTENISLQTVVEFIHANGIKIGERFYIFSADDAQQILTCLDKAFKEHSIIYYAPFYEKHLYYFKQRQIFSPAVLKQFLTVNDGRHFYYDDFVTKEKAHTLAQEISRIFNAAQMPLTLKDVQEKLPYVPPQKCREVLESVKNYLPTKKENQFVECSLVLPDTSELDEIYAFLNLSIRKKNFAMSEDYLRATYFARFSELTTRTLENFIFRRFLSSDFVRRGKKIFPTKKVSLRRIYYK